MKVKLAIMGAGLSGLACAIELEKHGIEPVIFESRSKVGDRFVNGEAFFSILSRPITDEVRYLSEQHQIFVRPSFNIRELLLHSVNRKASIKGNLGFFSVRGRQKDSLENQLAHLVRSKIHFHSKETYEDLLKEYTHVIMATGDSSYVQSIQSFELDVTVTLKGVTVEGDFSRNKAICWFDNQFAPHGGYGFLIPFSDKEATVALAFPEYDGLAFYDKTEMWKRYFDRVTRDMEQDLRVTDTYEVNRYMIGISKYPRIGNTFFVGNCFGALMPFMGFGQFSSILTGIYAAKDICGEGQYEQLTASLRRSYNDSLVLRRYMETLDNEALDKLVHRLSGFWGDKLANSRMNTLKWAAYALRVGMSVSDNRKKSPVQS